MMDDEMPSWLPPLTLFEDYRGNWSAYIDAVYRHFHKDFVESKPSFQRIPVFARYHPPYDEKGATFWHLISEGKWELERIPDLRRCERIRWPRPIIESMDFAEVRIWETIRPWKGQKQRRLNFALDNFSYIVVIAESRKGFDLVTAYHLEKPHRREKLRREFENFSGQKKEGSAV